ncbi:type VI secretion system baseplate subunit TssG [Cognatazoarcus halotolerans]|uniref:type VI secretion system baseplate subunit TssG n=1 Tax=Cognatazoarcus halotolerans TaxID=2686016 RepID=UPI0013569A05|nr:type VI secretion system baseplate subunit TssG [Cognatazoarcus halotolerans]MCP5309335.1 type VI secretion system baseplate subunit TssG [Zoogloeaceae bacterium]
MRDASDPLALFDALARKPYAFDFLQAMRRIECAFPDKPRWASARRPQDEPVRLAQEASLAFAPTSLSGFKPARNGVPPRLEVRFFGLLGPNGPMPLHLTEYARHRILHQGDETFIRFLDLIHHRFLALFYRAWAQAQPTVSLDRPQDDRFATYVGSLVGIGQSALQQRDRVPDNAKRFHAGLLARQVRNAEGLQVVLANYFELPVEVEQYAGHWMQIGEQDHSRLGTGSRLGTSAVLGRRVWDRQSKFRLHIGSMNLVRYESFLPGGRALPQLVDWIRFYTNGELAWDVRLRLKRDEVPPLGLKGRNRLGWTCWLGRPAARRERDDLVLDAERLLGASRFSRSGKEEDASCAYRTHNGGTRPPHEERDA